MSANGGDENGDGGSGGGGGRIAVKYTASAQAAQNLIAKPRITFRANQGRPSNVVPYTGGNTDWGRPGTIYFDDALVYPTETTEGGQIVIPGVTSFQFNNLTISNGFLVFPATSTITVTNDLLIRSGKGGLELSNGVLKVGRDVTMNGQPSSRTAYDRIAVWGADDNASSITIGRDLTLMSNSSFYVYSGKTNTTVLDYGMLVTVTGKLTMSTASWIYPGAHPVNGAAPCFKVASCAIGPGSGFNADSLGYRGKVSDGTTTNRGYGPGGGLYTTYAYGGGGGYGGYGGGTSTVNGIRNGYTYGSSNQPPFYPGSCGGPGSPNAGIGIGGAGGGLIWLEVAGTLDFNGTMTANGGKAGGGTAYAGSGSGGGIYVRCRTFTSTGGLFRANGADHVNGWGGSGGGGGRIAVFRAFGNLPGPVQGQAARGTDTTSWPPSTTGTVHWGQIPIPEPGIAIELR